MAKDYIIEQLNKRVKGRDFFSRKELYAFYKQFEPDLKETTFRWRIYDLKSKHLISPLSKELFTLSYKPVFNPVIGNTETKLFCKVEKEFPSIKACIWSTAIVREFMLHIPGKSIILLQVEKEAIEPVYSFLKELNYNIFIQPEEKEIERYIYEPDVSIVLQTLISKSPTQRSGNTTTVTLEKLIVDMFSDRKLFAAFQGSELAHIVNNAFSRYSIDFTRLLTYAKRRGKEQDIRQFFLDKTDIPKNILNDKP